MTRACERKLEWHNGILSNFRHFTGHVSRRSYVRPKFGRTSVNYLFSKSISVKNFAFLLNFGTFGTFGAIGTYGTSEIPQEDKC